MTPINFKRYGVNQAEPTVIAERISHWYQIDYNGNYGTEIVLDTGATIRVGEWPNQVEEALLKAQAMSAAAPVVEAAPPSAEAALQGLVDSLTKALDEAPLNDVLSTTTAMFVTLITDVCKHKGHDESLPIVVDGGDNRDITIHPPKAPADTVKVFGVKDGVETLIGSAPMPARMKARELARDQFGHFEDGDGSDAELCFGAMEQLIEHLARSSDVGKGLVS